MQIQEYASALDSLSASQAALLLSTQGFTNAQIAETLVAKEGSTEKAYQTMIEAGLLKSKQSLTNAELQNTIATTLSNNEDAKAVMSHMGLAVATEGEGAQTVKLTAKKLEEAVATGVLTKTQAQEIAMRHGVMIAQNKEVASTMPQWIAKMKAMTLATKEQAAKDIINNTARITSLNLSSTFCLLVSKKVSQRNTLFYQSFVVNRVMSALR